MISSVKYILVLASILILFSVTAAQNNRQELIINPSDKGFIPSWLVAGPVEFPLVGFGSVKDTIAIGEPNIYPVEGEYSNSILPEGENVEWFLQSIDKLGFIDFNSTLEWNVNTKIPVKIWYSKAGYAYTSFESDDDKEALLTLGSNSHIKVYLNKKLVYSYENARNASIDQDTVKVNIKKGFNEIIIRVLNTHNNLGLAFFGMIKWEWGFFARLLEIDGNPIQNIRYILKTDRKNSDFDIISTIYFKVIDNQLKQRFDIVLHSLIPGISSSKLIIKYNGEAYEFLLDSLGLGENRRSIYLPEVCNNLLADANLLIGDKSITKTIELKKRKKYNLHLMLLNHTDVGYTHPQPVCEELHANTLDEVIKMCNINPDFHWTIETIWQLEAYENLRSKSKFEELIRLIKNGRVAISPLYTNPFTGWVSEEEMIRSLDKAIEYKNRYGVGFKGAVYNDVPGQSWFLPQVLSKAGVKFVAEGINEFYGDYKLQRNLPKVFKWEASDGSQIVTYLNEAYNEGRFYGLESNDLLAVEQSIWGRISKLEARDYPLDIVLINSSFTDNGILAAHQYYLAMKWNEKYEYPKLISSNVDKFVDVLMNSREYELIPKLRGDWTSNWDIFYQGEFKRNKIARWSQHQLLSAEKLSTLSRLIDSIKLPMNKEISQAYRNLLKFSGHGSGLELGYGSPEENKLTMEFRDNYVESARLETEAVLLKSMHRLSKTEESLESEGIFIFNTLNWKRNDVVEIQYPFDTSPEYEVIDAVTNKIVPSFREGHKQYFVATDVPSFGYKKYLLKLKSSVKKFNSLLKSSDNSIENQFYKITYDKNNRTISSIVYKITGKELLNPESNFRFVGPTIERFQQNQMHSSITNDNVSYEIIDRNPFGLTLKIKREGDVIEAIEFLLIDGIDKIFVNAIANLKALTKTEIQEEFGLPFQFNIKNARVNSEILGGFIEQETDRLPGIEHDGVSLRRSVSIFNSSESILWSTADARVIRIRKDDITKEPVIISNLVNNFPEDWNRHEDLNDKINFRYALKFENGSFNPGHTSRFGYELNTPFQVRKSWYKPEPSHNEYLETDNDNIILINLKSVNDGIVLRLLNSDSQKEQNFNLKSKLFLNCTAEIIGLLGNKIRDLKVNGLNIHVEIKAGEFLDILIKTNYK